MLLKEDVIKFVIITSFKEVQLPNIISIFVTENTSKSDKSTEINDVHPWKKLIKLSQNSKSKLEKSTVIKEEH